GLQLTECEGAQERFPWMHDQLTQDAPPPIPTLSPYTTLFRSEPDDRLRDEAIQRSDPAQMDCFMEPVIGLRCVSTRRLAMMARLDRKSTRLNSSHVKSSYAVFSLKKKKIRQDRPSTSQIVTIR